MVEGAGFNLGVLCVSTVSTTKSPENEQHKCKMKWRSGRGAHWRRDTPAVKKKKVIGRQIWI